MVNVYIPPASSTHPTPTYRAALDDLASLLSSLPAGEPCLVVGDFNAKLGGICTGDGPAAACPCHGLPQTSLLGATCVRGAELHDFACSHGLHVLNGCPTLAQ